MKFRYHKNFQKAFLKLPLSKQELCQKRLLLFSTNPDHPILSRHSLKGKFNHHCSINAGGDLRIVYKEVSSEEIEFVALGTHNQLYG